MNNSQNNYLDAEKSSPFRHKSISVDSGYKNMNLSVRSYENEEINESQISQTKETKDINLEYFDLKNQKSFQLQSSCLWKIEGQNRKRGGVVQWDTPYRLRHFTSGKYLRVIEKVGIDDFDKVFIDYKNLKKVFICFLNLFLIF